MEPNGSDLSKQARGRWGERLAASHYRRRGYEVVDRNWRCTVGELDLVVRVGSTIVFVEVKARRSADFGGADVRFDVVAIDGVDLRVIEAAF